MTLRTQFVVVSLVAAFGCTGTMGRDSGGSDPSDDGSGGSAAGSGASAGGKGGAAQSMGGRGATTGTVDGKTCALPTRRVRQLTASQLEATLAKALPKGAFERLDIPRQGRGGNGFSNDSDRLLLSLNDVQQHYGAMVKLADAVAASPGSLASCLGGTPDEACVGSFVSSFAAKLFRHPLTDEERSDLVTFWKERRANDASSALSLLLRRMFLSPQLLFRPELGGAASGGVVALTAYEKASALAFTITDGPPDDELMADARSGALDQPDRLTFHAERLLAKADLARGVLTMMDELFRVNAVIGTPKDEIYQGYSAAIAEDMAQETRAFLREVLWNDKGTIETLLTAPYTVANGRLASFYGLSGKTASDATFTKVAAGQQPRVGILGQGSMLTTLAHANQNDLVKRGRFVRELLLCEEVPAPPPTVNAVPPPPMGDFTLRERLAMHSKDPSCAGCHKLMDPIGFAFERFDGVGRYRDKDAGKAIDARGEIVDSRGSDGTFDGLVELGAHLAKSTQVRDCLARTTFRFVFGRHEDDADACALDAANQALVASGGDLKRLVTHLVTSPAFTQRSAQ